MEKLIITIAPTGSVPRKRDTEYLPLTPDEIADTAYLCEQEGASIIHVHCRDEHENPTSDYQTFKETVDKIRKRTRLIVMVSTSGIAGTSNEERAEPLKTNPEMASLTTGSLNFTGRKPPVVYMNSWETIVHLARTMSELNIKPELEAFDVGFIHQGIKLLETFSVSYGCRWWHPSYD
ncbi:MAG: 3-keto-5-aminohexanoate cleavage protein [Candidatus Thorarchaeota archaeon]|jgi:3-keto-5-aminohexanoate cleavage enzyme